MSEIPTYPNEVEDKERAEHDRKFIRAMRIIFAYAKKWEESTPQMPVYHRFLSRVDGGEISRWKVYIDGKIETFTNPEKACIALSEFLITVLPSLVKEVTSENHT